MLTEEESTITATFAQLSQILRIPVATGKVFGLLFANPAGLTFTDITEKLSLSKPSVSHALQFLTGCRAVSREPAIESGGHFYRCASSGRQVAEGFLRSELVPILEQEITRLKKGPKTERTTHLKKGLTKALRASKALDLILPKAQAN